MTTNSNINKEEKGKFALPKGFKDFLPEEQIIREKLKSILKEVFEKYGFEPLETPVLEFEETLASKYAGGAEIVKQIYKVTDRAGRKLALKYDQTVPLCRVFASNPQLGRPFKRYQMDRAWRDEFGTRDREFWQCDVDVIGPSSMLADIEYIAIFDEIFSKLKLEVIIKVNNRKLLDGIMDYSGLKKEQFSSAILSIDKLEKIGEEAVIKDASEKGIEKEKISKILELLKKAKGNLDFFKEKIKSDEGKQGIKELEELFNYVKILGIKTAKFEPTLARGLEYYTGTVFEVYLKSGAIKGSLGAGGRFDNIVGNFLGTEEKIPAVGVSVGLSRIYDALIAEKKAIAGKTVVKVYIIPMDTEIESLKILKSLRDNNINADMDFMSRSLSKNIEYANKKGIPFVAIIGERELKEGKIKLKDMKTGKEELLEAKKIIDKLK